MLGIYFFNDPERGVMVKSLAKPQTVITSFSFTHGDIIPIRFYAVEDTGVFGAPFTEISTDNYDVELGIFTTGGTSIGTIAQFTEDNSKDFYTSSISFTDQASATAVSGLAVGSSATVYLQTRLTYQSTLKLHSCRMACKLFGKQFST